MRTVIRYLEDLILMVSAGAIALGLFLMSYGTTLLRR